MISLTIQFLTPIFFFYRAFGIPMGLAGHAIMWKAMRNAEFVSKVIDVRIVDILNMTFWYLASIVSGVIAVAYIYKIFTFFPLVLAEWLNEVRCHL